MSVYVSVYWQCTVDTVSTPTARRISAAKYVHPVLLCTVVRKISAVNEYILGSRITPTWTPGKWERKSLRSSLLGLYPHDICPCDHHVSERNLQWWSWCGHSNVVTDPGRVVECPLWAVGRIGGLPDWGEPFELIQCHWLWMVTLW